jgi:hypothetical protein
MNENNNLNYMQMMFGIQNWKTGDEELDKNRIEAMLNEIRSICRDMNAAQIKAFLLALVIEIDKRAKI